MARRRRRARPQSHGQGQDRPLAPVLRQRAGVHLSRPPGRGHPLLQGQPRPGWPGPAPSSRDHADRRPPLRRPVRRRRRRVPPARRPAVERAPPARYGRHQDEQEPGERHHAGRRRRRDRPSDQGCQDGRRPAHHPRPRRPARGVVPAPPDGALSEPRPRTGRRRHRFRGGRRAEEDGDRGGQRTPGAGQGSSEGVRAGSRPPPPHAARRQRAGRRDRRHHPRRGAYRHENHY